MSIGIIASLNVMTYFNQKNMLNKTNHEGIYRIKNNNEIIISSRSLEKNNIQPRFTEQEYFYDFLNKNNTKFVLTSNMVGSLNVTYKPNSYGIINQFIDFTKEVTTRYQHKAKPFDFTAIEEPFCSKLNKIILDTCLANSLCVHENLCCMTVSGPRYETAAEINAYKILGADVIGMSISKDAILANEYNIDIGSLGFITNYAAGIGKSFSSHDDIKQTSINSSSTIAEILYQSANTFLEKHV